MMISKWCLFMHHHEALDNRCQTYGNIIVIQSYLLQQQFYSSLRNLTSKRRSKVQHTTPLQRPLLDIIKRKLGKVFSGTACETGALFYNIISFEYCPAWSTWPILIICSIKHVNLCFIEHSERVDFAQDRGYLFII